MRSAIWRSPGFENIRIIRFSNLTVLLRITQLWWDHILIESIRTNEWAIVLRYPGPVRSPYLNPWYFLLIGYIKDFVYLDLSKPVEELKEKFSESTRYLNTNMLENVFKKCRFSFKFCSSGVRRSIRISIKQIETYVVCLQCLFLTIMNGRLKNMGAFSDRVFCTTLYTDILMQTGEKKSPQST